MDDPEASSSPDRLPLTWENLSTLNHLQGTEPPLSISQTETWSDGSGVETERVKGKSVCTTDIPQTETHSDGSSVETERVKGKSVCTIDEETYNHVLELYCINPDPTVVNIPPDVQELIKLVLPPPSSSIEVDAKFKIIARAQLELVRFSKRKFDRIIGHELFPDEFGGPDDALLDKIIGEDEQWGDCIPKPTNRKAGDFEKITEEHGSLPKPRPDLAYGYFEKSFSVDNFWEVYTIRKILPMRRPLWWPWLIVQTEGSTPTGQTHRRAIRNAPAAIATFHDSIRRLIGKDPSAGFSAVFSLCVNTCTFYLRVHWRHTDGQGAISWQHCEVMKGMMTDAQALSQLRRSLDKIMEWALGDRLEALKAVLQEWKQQLFSRVRHNVNANPRSTSKDTDNVEEGSSELDRPAKKQRKS